MSTHILEQLEGKYEILEKISEGGMGAVYKVRHRLLDEVRVIKLIRPQLESDKDVRARFLREARTTVRLHHHNIAQFFDLTMDDQGNAFVVMEFVDGLTIESLLEKIGPLDVALALELAEQSLEALGYLHRRSIVHRDVSPDNLMVTRGDDGQPVVKLIDLGIAKVLGGGSKLTATGTFLGKIRYASPEQFAATTTDDVDARSDLYSMGIVLYEMLTGRHPIRGSDLSSLIAGHMMLPPVPFDESDEPGRVPDDLRRIVMRALEKAPGDRFATAGDFVVAICSVAPRFPLDREAFGALMDRLVRPREKSAAIPVPATTQAELDRQFGREATPAPRAVLTDSTPAGGAQSTAEPAVSDVGRGLEPPDRAVPLPEPTPAAGAGEESPAPAQPPAEAERPPKRPLSATVKRTRRVSPPSERAATSLLAEARLLMEAGRPREAMVKLRPVLAADAANEDALSLEKAAQDALRAQDGAARAEAEAVEAARRAREQVAAARREAELARPAPAPLPERPSERPTQVEAPPPLRPAPAPALETAPQPAPPVAPQPELRLAPRRRARLRALAGIAAAVVLAIIVFALRQTPSPRPPVLVTGTLVVNAVPWGEVARVTDSGGRDLPLAGDHITPCALELPAGTYTVTVRNPRLDREATVQAVVASGQVARTRVELATLTPGDLLHRLGL